VSKNAHKFIKLRERKLAMETTAKVIAVSGKGGVGKTTLAAAMVRHLTECKPDARILAIDADPAVGLSTCLGVDVTLTLDEIRKQIIDNVEEGRTKEAMDLVEESRYRIFDALVEKNGFAFLAIEGCYCRINAYLKDVITMLSREFDYVVIDGEAGIEQINRRVLEKVTHLLLVSDQSRKGIQVVGTIKQVADELVMYDIGAVINRVTNPDLNKFITIPGVEILSYIESDDYHAANDIQGKTVYDLPPESSVYRGTKEVLEKFGIL
jgi:CO dehydrogenase maturation factor